MVIPGNQRAVILVGSSRTAVQYTPGYNCNVGVSFDALADAQYELQYRYENNACSVRLYEIKVSQSAVVTKVAVPGARAFRAQQYADQCPFR